MGYQGTGHLHRHQDLRPGDHHGGWILVALHGSHGELPASDGRHQYPARLHRPGDLLRTVLLFRLELPQLRNGGAQGSLQVITVSFLNRDYKAAIILRSAETEKNIIVRLNTVERLDLVKNTAFYIKTKILM